MFTRRLVVFSEAPAAHRTDGGRFLCGRYDSSSTHCLPLAGFSQPAGWITGPLPPGSRSLRGPAGHGPGGWVGTRRGSTHRTMEGPATVGTVWESRETWRMPADGTVVGPSETGDAHCRDHVGSLGAVRMPKAGRGGTVLQCVVHHAWLHAGPGSAPGDRKITP